LNDGTKQIAVCTSPAAIVMPGLVFTVWIAFGVVLSTAA